ncbi:MAG: bactofilin family protein [bacterium JZ-2024 1]
MFGTARDKKTEKVATLIGPNASVQGSINELNSLRVDGHFYGDITTEGDAFVGKMGYVRGNVKGRSVFIFGKIEGNVEAQERLEILEGGLVEGDIKTKRLVVYEGAAFRGRCEMEDIVVQPSSEGTRVSRNS